jgi:hypothetical protein
VHGKDNQLDVYGRYLGNLAHSWNTRRPSNSSYSDAEREPRNEPSRWDYSVDLNKTFDQKVIPFITTQGMKSRA